jgi:hypothetical protein
MGTQNAAPEKHPTPGEFASLIGAFLMNFGSVELALFQWIKALARDEIVWDIALEMTLNKRLGLVCDLIKRSTRQPDWKQKSLAIWKEIEKFSEIRNVIAHNPILTDKKSGAMGFLNLKKLKGSHGRIPALIFNFKDVSTAGSRMAVLANEVIKPIRWNNG